MSRRQFPSNSLSLRFSANNRIISYVHSLNNGYRTPILTHALLNDAYNGLFQNVHLYKLIVR